MQQPDPMVVTADTLVRFIVIEGLRVIVWVSGFWVGVAAPWLIARVLRGASWRS